MKKLLCIVGAVGCLLMVGCAAEPETPENNAPTSSDTTTTTTTTTTTATTTTATTATTAGGFISEEAALQIAYDYWNFTPGEDVSVGKGDENDPKGKGMVSIATYPTEDAPYYEAVYSWLVPGPEETSHRSVIDHVWINAVTGETSVDLPS